MADLLIRNLNADIVRRLKLRAKRHGRSLQGEARQVLETAAGIYIAEALAGADRIRKRLDKTFSDSAELIRKDRTR